MAVNLKEKYHWLVLAAFVVLTAGIIVLKKFGF